MFTVKCVLILCIVIGILMYIKEHLDDINVCPHCEGKGFIDGMVCPYCDGSGKRF